jgi:general secretion pathway protein D
MKLSIAASIAAAILLNAGCTSYQAYQKAHTAEVQNDWDQAVREYAKALEVDPGNLRYRISLQRATLEASRAHFEKGKSLRAAHQYDLAAMELELAVKLDPTNQYAAVELEKAVIAIQDANAMANHNSLEQMKRRAVTKAAPPQLNPASSAPISLSFPRPTPVKDIFRALGNSFGMNILFDQSVKDDEKVSIELRDVTAQQALERVMQASNDFYKVLDEKTIIVVADNPQNRRDYEDLVIQTFYLSNGDAEQVANVVRTMIEARSVFPLKALNAITIRDTADKVRIAEKIIQANDKARAEVVVDVELLQMDMTKGRELGIQIASVGSSGSTPFQPIQTLVNSAGAAVTSLTLDQLKNFGQYSWSFNVPSVLYGFVKDNSDAKLLAKPQLRISEGEKATLHIGQKIPVPVSTFTSATTSGGTFAPVTSFQYQDVGIKISIEPRVHHNREVTLKLTVEVSNLNGFEASTSPPQPIIGTRNIESTIRLKDGETNFLAGLIQNNETTSSTGTPFLSDLPIIGRLFSKERKDLTNTDLVLTMTPHIIRIPDITEDDLAPMWVGTSNNLTFRGVTPRIESQSAVDPFNSNSVPVTPEIETTPGEVQGGTSNSPGPASGTPPNDPFKQRSSLTVPSPVTSAAAPVSTVASTPRISPQPVIVALKPGEKRNWSVIGMDLDGLSTSEITVHYDPRAITVEEVMLGPAVANDPRTPPAARIDPQSGTITITSTDGKSLNFVSGGEIMILKTTGNAAGETFLTIDPMNLKNAAGATIEATIVGGKAEVQ